MINQVHNMVEGNQAKLMVAHDKLNKIHDQLGQQNSILKLIVLVLIVNGGLLAALAWG